MLRLVSLACLIAAVLSVPLSVRDSQLYDIKENSDVDTKRNYFVFVFDGDCDADESCRNSRANLEAAARETDSDAEFERHRQSLGFLKVNKNDFPKYKKEIEKFKVTLPVIVFWPNGHFRPTCKFDDNPTPPALKSWMISKLNEASPAVALMQMPIDPVTQVCKISEHANPPANDVTCGDLLEARPLSTEQGLMQLERTQKIWDFKKADTVFTGPADNSLSYTLTDKTRASVAVIDSSATYLDNTKQGKYQALYFYAPWCDYCGCLAPVWQGVASNLVGSQRQPELIVAQVDGDANTDLRTLFNITVYPTFVVVNKDGSKVLGRYLGPRKVFELSNWIEDLIVADTNEVVKHKFTPEEEGPHSDINPVYPYSGPTAYKVPPPDAANVAAAQVLASVDVSLMGNDFEECVDADERKFTAPGAALLVHYSSDASAIRALEMDSQMVARDKVPEKYIVVDFFAQWCPHCQHLAPVWDSVNTHYKDSANVVVGKVDIEAHPDIKNAFGIHRFPTIMYFEPGKPMTPDEGHRFTGQRDEQHLIQWIDQIKGK